MKFVPYLFRIRKLSYLIRFPTGRRVVNQSVADHCFHAAMIALLICQNEKIALDQQGLILSRILLHDLEEVEVSDVPRPVKSRVPGLREALEEKSRDFLETYLIFSLDQDVQRRILNLWENAKDKTFSGQVVSFADTCELSLYCLNEWDLGNKSLKDAIEFSIRHLMEIPISSEIESCKGIVAELQAIYNGDLPISQYYHVK